MTKLVDSLLARKLLIAFLLAFAGQFLDAITGAFQTAQPITVSLLEAAAAGAFVAALRGLLALSPLNIVPSDAAHTFGAKP